MKELHEKELQMACVKNQDTIKELKLKLTSAQGMYIQHTVDLTYINI